MRIEPAAGIIDVWACGACGSVAYPGDRYCACCGSALQRMCPRCSTPVLQPVANFCTQCGSNLTTGADLAPERADR